MNLTQFEIMDIVDILQEERSNLMRKTKRMIHKKKSLGLDFSEDQYILYMVYKINNLSKIIAKLREEK